MSATERDPVVWSDYSMAGVALQNWARLPPGVGFWFVYLQYFVMATRPPKALVVAREGHELDNLINISQRPGKKLYLGLITRL